MQRGLDAASSVSRQAVVVGGALSPLPTARSVVSSFHAISIAGARTRALALGGSRNDLLVAATAAGLGLYHQRLGLSVPPELRLAMPARRHRDGSPGGNWFAPTRVVVPTSGDHPGPFFGVVAERLDRARHEPAVPLAGSIAAGVSLLPTRALLPVIRSQARSVDFVATCFAGLRSQRTICEAAIEESYPFGPRFGCLLNATAFGIDGRLDVGLSLDSLAVSQPDLLVECLRVAFDHLVDGRDRPGGSRTRATRT
jgi:hypothetical protein